MGIKKTEVCSSVFDALMLERSHNSHALLLIDGRSISICMSLECQMVILIGSDLVIFNVDVTRVTTFYSPLTAPDCQLWRGSLSHVSPVASPLPWLLRIELQWRLCKQECTAYLCALLIDAHSCFCVLRDTSSSKMFS